MKKKLARFLTTFVLVLCLCLGLTACGKDKDDNKDNSGDDNTPAVTAKVTSISVGLAEGSSYTLIDGKITISYGGGSYQFVKADFKVTATLDNNTTKVLGADEYTFSSTIPTTGTTQLGDYTLTFGHTDLAETAYKTITVKVVQASINPSSLNLTWTDSTGFKYDGTAKTVTITNLPDYLEVTSYSGNTETYPNGSKANSSSAAQAEIYTATATLKVKDDQAANYTLTSTTVSHDWTIAKGTIAVPTLTSADMESYTYASGTSRTATLSNAKRTELTNRNIEIQFSDTTEKTNAGTYTVNILFTYTGEDVDCYELTSGNQVGSTSVTWKINPIQIITNNLILTLGSTNYYNDTSFTYDGSEKRVYFYLGNFNNEYISGSNPILSYTETDTNATNAGDYTATITFTVNESYSNNYTVSNASVSRNWKINKCEIDVSSVALKIKGGDAYSSAFTYDGNEKSVVFNLSSLYPTYVSESTCPMESDPASGGFLPSTGTSILSYEGNGTFSATNVGEYTTTITFTIANILNYQQNYKFAGTTENSVTITKTWEIAERTTTPLTLKVNTNDVDNQFTYGDAITLTAENVTATGLNAGDTIASLGTLSFVYSTEENGTYTSTVPTTAGKWYVKVAEFVGNDEAGATNGFENYSITYQAGAIKINPKVIVLTAKDQTILQGEDLPTGQVADYSRYLVGDDAIDDLGIKLTFTYTYTSSETGNTITLSYDKNYDCSGTYTIHVSASFTNDNYTNKGATNITGTLKIKQVDVYLDVFGFAKNPETNEEDQQTASPIEVDRNSSGSQQLGINQIIKGLIVKVDNTDIKDNSVATAYSDLVATAYSDETLTQAIDFKDINSWNDVGFWIVVKKDDKTIFVSEYNAYSVNFITTYYVNEYHSEDVTISDKLVTYTLTEAGNFEFTMPDALNGATLKQYYKTGDGSYAEGPIAVVSGVNNIDYKLTIKIGDDTYTYETDLQVIVSTSAQSVLSEDAGYSASFGSMNVNGNEVETSSENYNAGNINELKKSIDDGDTTLNYDGSKYGLTSQTSEIVGNTLLVTIVLTEKDTTDPEEGESEFSSGVELYAGETKTVTIILVIKFSGWVDNDTGAVINYRNEKDEFKQTIGNEITTATSNNFRIELNNHYATWKLEAEAEEEKTTITKENVGEHGELKDYWSPEAGSTWKLTITATDGTTTRTITINVVEAEQTPDIKLTIDDDTQTTLFVYGFEDGEPTGDFVVSQVLDDVNFKNIARFYAYLGSDYLNADQTTITISSLEFNEDGYFYEIICMIKSIEDKDFTWKDTNDTDINFGTDGSFTLTINKTDPDAPYAKFYIGGKFDMSEMGDMSEYDATAEEITPEEGSGEQSFEAEMAVEFYIYFCENANELEDLPDDDTSIIVQMYGASITKSNFKYNKVSNTYVGTFKNLWLYQIGESIKIERLKTSLGTADISKSFAREETPWGVGVKIKLTATTDTYIVLLFLDSDKSELDYYESNFGKLSETTFSVTIDGKTATQDNIDYRAKKDDGPTKIFIKINKKKEGLEPGEHGIKIDDISFDGKYNDGNWFLLACYDNTYVKISDMGDNKWLSVYNYSHGETAVFFIATTKTYLEENGFNENMFHSTNDTDYRWVYEICVVFSDSKGEGLEETVHVFESEFAGEDADGNAKTLKLNFKAESLTDSVTAKGSDYVIQENYCIVATVGENNEFKFTTVGSEEYITMTSFTPKTELIVFRDSKGNVIFSGSAPDCAIANDNGYKLKVLTYTYNDNGEEKTVKYVQFYVYLSDGYNFYGYEDGYLPCYIIFDDEIPQGLFLTKNDYYKVTFNDSVSSFVTLQDADYSVLVKSDYMTLVNGNIIDNKGTVTNSTTKDGDEQIDVVVKYGVTVQDLETLRAQDTYSLNINVSNWILIFGSVTLTDGGNSSNKVTVTNACKYSITLKMQTTDTECFVSFSFVEKDGTIHTFKCLFEAPSASGTEAE